MTRVTLMLLMLTFLASCTKKSRFTLLNADQTGIHFNNKVEETDTLNPLNYIYLYNGGGVAAGDINNDGLDDLFFTGNLNSSALYLNEGGMKFKDITEAAGVTDGVWATGVTFIDINADGWQDIYVCAGDRNYTEKGKNRLYINQGDNTFVESASAYGIADSGFSTQAAFFDYDQDGDLDLYLLTNAIEDFSHNNTRPRKMDGSGLSTDRLYRNNGDQTFTNVSEEAGITIEGYGLGVGVFDVNGDGLPDVYCANDFITNDLLWVNNGDGTFTESAEKYLSHTSYNGMGVDIADFNNDLKEDIIVVDMLPEDNMHHKTMTPAMNYNNQLIRFEMGYMPQYVRNTLQMQNGKNGFNEVGRLAGIQKTDWSWAPLFADLDNDGWKDLFISNGYGRDITDLDYIKYSENAVNPFGTQDARDQSAFEELMKLPSINLPNYFYRNTGDGRFEDLSAQWSEQENSMSNGAVYADLDLDGDLDLVTNNLNGKAFVYQNNSRQMDGESTHYLQLRLQGDVSNPGGIGSSVTIYHNGQSQTQNLQPVRGYLSAVTASLHFGTGTATAVDSIHVVWPDNKQTVLYDVKTDTALSIAYTNAEWSPRIKGEAKLSEFMLPKKITGAERMHRENLYIDFLEQPLLLQMLSREGPGLAIGDINLDGRDDLVMGTAFKDTTYVMLQDESGGFQKSGYLPESWNRETSDCLVADFNADGLPDIFLANGGNEYVEGSQAYGDLLYLQLSDGRFELSDFSDSNESSAVIAACDYDKDGDLDVFVGARVSPKRYPYSGNSRFFVNQKGVFKDKTTESASAFSQLGMVTDAVWSDLNNDDWPDLVVVGEWMAPRVFMNHEGILKEETERTGLAGLSGFYNCVATGDFDKDGDTDLVLGNRGLNTEFRASKSEPLTMLAKDFDNNGSIDPIIGYYVNGVQVPYASRDALLSQINPMKKRFRYYRDYGKATFDDILLEAELNGALNLEITTLESLYLENEGNATFAIQRLPLAVQQAPVSDMLVTDINADGNPDLLTVGNRRDTETLSGFLDGGYGAVLLGDGKGGLEVLPVESSGFYVPEDARRIKEVNLQGRRYIVVAINNGPLRFFELSKMHKSLVGMLEKE